MLSDPVIKALMAADRVAPEELQANLRKVGGALELRHREVPRQRCP